MDSNRPENPQVLLSLEETAVKLAVSVDVLLKWNEFNILKPTITQDGKIGYTQEQIDQFLSIRTPLQPTKIIESDLLPQEKDDAKILNELSTSNQSAIQLLKSDITGNKKPFPVFAVVSTIIIVVLIGIGAFTQRSSLKAIVSSYIHSRISDRSSVLGSQTSEYSFKTTGISPTPVMLGISSQDKALHDESKNSIINIPSPAATNSGKSQTLITRKSQVTTKTIAAIQKPQENNSSIPLPNNIHPVDIGEASTKSTNPENKKDVLAINLGSPNIAEQDTNKANTFATFAVVGTFGLLLLYALQSQLAFVLRPRQSSSIQPLNEQSEKILAVNQKMDGTVVVYFQQKEYKVCKPELYSDSDQFIERLIELTPPGIKEIEYDSISDDKLRLSTPLSRIVTRLGFVGIKRDLFFPRTSKSRVLFRRYITHHDLLVMNLTLNDIVSDLTKIA